MKTCDLSHAALDLKRFTFDKAKRTLTAMASDFGPVVSGTWWLARLYPDACDEGIAIRSEITGKVEYFVLSRGEVIDGDLIAWHFKPLNKLANVASVTIYND